MGPTRSGSQINSITPAYAKVHGFVVRPLEKLAGDTTGQAFQGIGGIRTGAIGYVVFWVRIEGIPNYDEEQVALVIEDSSSFSKKVPVPPRNTYSTQSDKKHERVWNGTTPHGLATD